MSKKLTLTDIKNENKIYDQKKKVTLSDEYYVYVYPNFSPIKISELIREVLTDPQRAKDADINFDEINMADWGLFNIIYKFTDLGIPNDIKKKVQAFTEIMNSEYWGKIIESFPQESIQKITDSLNRFSENFESIVKENTDVDKLLDDESKLIQ
jgi:hypothetical protein